MRIVWRILLIAAVLVLYFLLRPTPLPDEARIAATTWLARSCSVGERRNLESVMEKSKPQLEPFFLEALERGPGAGLIAREQKAAEERFQERQEALQTGDGLGLSPEDLQEARSVTREQYLDQEKQDFMDRYKSQAVTGLGIVGGQRARAALEAIARDPDNSLYGSAVEALRLLPNGKAAR